MTEITSIRVQETTRDRFNNLLLGFQADEKERKSADDFIIRLLDLYVASRRDYHD